eukprot:COSAG01_NODE_1134_length_11558_cov_8.381360_14_plen_109_part_00
MFQGRRAGDPPGGAASGGGGGSGGGSVGGGGGGASEQMCEGPDCTEEEGAQAALAVEVPIFCDQNRRSADWKRREISAIDSVLIMIIFHEMKSTEIRGNLGHCFRFWA